MNISVAKRRMNEVLAVDSINSTQFDFLATHVPFRKIVLKTGKNGVTENISEDEVFDKLFSPDGMNRHQLIIVEGPSGAGKSHFIRWIHAKLSDQENEVVLLIRRSDNTLKGTIRQLLEIDAIKSISNKEAYDRLVKANQTISDQKFKNEIYHRFLVEIESDEREDGLSSSEKKRLIALLSNELFKNRLFAVNGPIDRIFSKISSTEITGSGETDARFETSDFEISVDFQEKMDDSGCDRKAAKMANDIIIEGKDYIESIASYMNSFIDDVVRSCAGIEAGDFQQIFKEIRRELYKQHKSLILLVEDITSFTGINKELLNALVTEHTGLNANDNLCRLISVVGTTSEYYKTFRDNYVDRITSQITINDGTIGENDNDLVQFVARYLNAISIERDELEKWQKNGAVLSEMPIHSDLNADIWGSYELEGRRMSLYPFNERSIKLLFRAMPNAKTPRYIIREIIEPGVNEIITSPSEFPSFCMNWRSPMDEVEKEPELNMIINSVKELAVSENDKAKIRSRVSSLIGFWGNCKLAVSKNGALAGINKAIFIQIGLNEVYNKFGKNTEPEDDTLIVEKDSSSTETSSQVIAPPVVTIDPEQEKRKQDYNAFRNCVLRWHTDKVKLVRFQEVRDEICSFAYNTINWQQSGVPVALMDVLENTKMELIGFDRQDQGIDKTLIVLPDNDETYQLLLCFGKWKYLGKKSWNYSNAVSDAYFATKWLEKHKKEIVSTVLGTVEGGVPVYTKAAMILELYRRIFNCSLKASRISELSRDDFISDCEARDQTISQNTGYTTEWNAVLDLIYSNAPQLKNEFIKKNFNLVMGSMFNSSKIIFNRSLFNKALKSLKDSDFTVQPLGEEAIDLKIKPKAEMNEFCQRIISKSERAAKSMYDQGKTIRTQIMEYFGYDDDLELDSGDIRSMLDKIAEFYEEAIRTGVNIIQQKNTAMEMKKRADDISKAVNSLNFEYDDKKQFEILVSFSNNPIQKLLQFLQLLKQASSDCDNVIQLKTNEKEQLTRSGKWEGDVDSRFEKNADKFNSIYNSIFGGDTDVGRTD